MSKIREAMENAGYLEGVDYKYIPVSAEPENGWVVLPSIIPDDSIQKIKTEIASLYAIPEKEIPNCTIPEELFAAPETVVSEWEAWKKANFNDYLPPAEKVRLLEAEIDQLEDELVEAKQTAKDKLNAIMHNTDELIVSHARLQLERDNLIDMLRHSQNLNIEYLCDLQIYKAHPWRLVLDKITEIVGRIIP